MIQPPVNFGIEATAALVKGAISAVPLFGGVLSELGNIFLNPLERRKQAWMLEVSTALNSILDRHHLQLADLQTDEQFITFLYQATSAALRTHQAVKLQALRNALTNSVIPGKCDGDLALLYLRYIDELTPSHLLCLYALEEHQAEYALHASLAQVIATLRTQTQIAGDQPTVRAFLQDLEARFLLRLGDIDELPQYASKQSMMLREESAIRPIEVTAQGARFLSFIRS